jgi:N-acetylmuramic acid 6-phosphate etherase
MLSGLVAVTGPAVDPLPSTEAADPRYRELDDWPIETALAAIWESQLAAVAAVRPALPAIAKAVAAAASALGERGRLVYVGAGTSGRIAAQDGAELPPTFDWPRDRLLLLMAGGPAAFVSAAEGAEDDAEAGQRGISEAGIAPQDVVIGVAASGNTRFTCAALADAAARGAVTVAVANSAAGRLLTLAAYPVLVDTGAEPLAGSTRLKAGTAQKVVLNLFSTQLMVQLGRVHRGLMVDMNAGNQKLRDRAVRMLRTLSGADEPAARAALAQTGWRVKPAVLVLNGQDRDAANRLLAAHGGRLRDALRNLPR